MNKELAIECIKTQRQFVDDTTREAFDMAIEALKAQPCEDTVSVSEEIWKPIKNYEGFYEISDKGNVRSVERVVKSGRGHRTVPSTLLKPALGEWGYETVSLSKNNKHLTQRVNRLVAQAFIPNPNNYPQVNHIDGNKLNNCVENLEWCNASQNMLHCHINGLSGWGTPIRIVETGEVFNSVTNCARAINGQVSLIRACLDGKRKTHNGYHFEIAGERASEKYNRKNVKNSKDEYENEIKITYDGETHSFRKWSEILGVKQSTLVNRYFRGDRGERLFRPIRKRGAKD